MMQKMILHSMRNLILVLFVFSYVSSFGQKMIFKKYESDDLKDIRDVKIYLPKSYEQDSIGRYPLTIVLEEEKLFDLYVGYANFFATQDQAPEQIIVGVNLKESYEKDLGFNTENSKLNDESRLFYTFLRDELIPYVELNFRTSPFLSVVGEGLGGNFINYFLQEEVPVFNTYISLNPTLAPDIKTQLESFNIGRMSSMKTSFYYYLSGNPYNKKEGALAKIKTLGKYMQGIGIKNFKVTFDELNSSPSNVSVLGEAISRAFAKVFEAFSGITQEEYNKNIKDLDPQSAIEYLKRKYEDIQALFGANIGVRQRDVVAIENIIIEQKDGDYLRDFGEMILNLYPTSEMGHYYLGRYYESGKNYEQALEQYRMGYGKMNPANPNADLYYQNVERMIEKKKSGNRD